MKLLGRTKNTLTIAGAWDAKTATVHIPKQENPEYMYVFVAQNGDIAVGKKEDGSDAKVHALEVNGVKGVMTVDGFRPVEKK